MGGSGVDSGIHREFNISKDATPTYVYQIRCESRMPTAQVELSSVSRILKYLERSAATAGAEPSVATRIGYNVHTLTPSGGDQPRLFSTWSNGETKRRG